ncbi:MAG TPA: hypothetical protein EYP78_06110 [Candidatus Omnitrophica bacterium]|nr:hypothetical protein [Candidatus Omnitrophota bacterium]
MVGKEKILSNFTLKKLKYLKSLCKRCGKECKIKFDQRNKLLKLPSDCIILNGILQLLRVLDMRISQLTEDDYLLHAFLETVADWKFGPVKKGPALNRLS